MRYIEITTSTTGNKEVIRLPFIQNVLVLLGFGAIFLNFIFVLICIYKLIIGKGFTIPRWMIVFNFMVFIWQIAFYFNLYK